jgi:glyoxylase-like metal-dependent hydrolase (beta-lactamase superfamily II)
LIIKSITVGPVMTNCYVVGCEETRKGVVIDPGDEVDRILLLAAEEKLAIEHIINTHGHFDHVGGNSQMKKATGADLMIHGLDAPMLDGVAASASAWGLRAENSPKPDRLLEEGDEISFGNLTFKVIHTPGHTQGGISLLADGDVFVGDTLFAGSVGRTDFPGGDFNVLKESIQKKLFALDDAVKVWPGHNEGTTIVREKRTNPFVGI